MKIAQVAPLWESVPPSSYGGVELVVSHLTEELIERGHDVTLFASGDSQTQAQLESVYSQALRLDSTIVEPQAYETLHMVNVLEKAHEFDLIHFHNSFFALPFGELMREKSSIIHTLHGGFTPENLQVFHKYSHHYFISLSNAQREVIPKLNYISTVYNGINLAKLPFQDQPSSPPYLAFLGRISPEKGPHHAIAIAKETGWQLKIAGKVDTVDQEFFDREIAPQIDHDQIQFLGEVTQTEKLELLANASATLFPITWEEPFGLVMIESMATGTPVLAMNRGSVPEVISDGETGFICSSWQEMVEKLPEAVQLNRQKCRERVRDHFSITQMVSGYESAYQQILNLQKSGNGKTELVHL
jgi:glycosyltransferase involved in cell wall biosynthesis